MIPIIVIIGMAVLVTAPYSAYYGAEGLLHSYIYIDILQQNNL